MTARYCVRPRTLEEMRKIEPEIFSDVFDKKITTSGGENVIFNNKEVNRMNTIDAFNMADEGGLRNKEKLTSAQKDEIERYALLLEIPDDKIFFSDYQETVYADGDDYVVFGRDVLPISGKSDNPNNNVSWKGAVAHEIVGHREAKLKGHTQPDRVLEDVQASIRAAKFAPGLNNAERVMLVRDAVFRLSKRGRSLRPIKHLLHINER